MSEQIKIHEDRVPSNPTDRQKLKAMLTEITHCMLRIEDEQSAIKDIVDDAAEKFDVDKKLLKKLAKTMHKRNYSDVMHENESFETFYTILIEGQKTSEDE